MPKSTEDLIEIVNAQHTEIRAGITKAAETAAETQNRLTAVEQKLAGMGGRGVPGRHPTWGSVVASSDRLKNFKSEGFRGACRIEIKNEITTPSGVDQGTLVQPDFAPIQGLPQQALTLRSLIPSTPTSSNLIQFVRQIARDNRAAPVAPGAQKPESDFEFELAESSVRTIAHTVTVTRQTFEDTAGLQALIDSEMRFGLRLTEEDQILIGDGTGQNILGLIPQAQTFAPAFAVADENALDRILLAIVQAQEAKLPVDGVLLNPQTWAEMISLKDSEGRYLSGQGGGPFGQVPNLLWQVKVVPTWSLGGGEALVGAFGLGARLHDRMDVEVLISSESGDNFVKNLLTIRAEERVALTCRVPSAFVYLPDLGAGFTS